jgi:hypothetical protein
MLRCVALVRTDVLKELICSVHQLLVMPNVVPSSPILVTLTMEALSSSEMSVLTGATWHNIPEDAILHKLTCFARWPDELALSVMAVYWQEHYFIHDCTLS